MRKHALFAAIAGVWFISSGKTNTAEKYGWSDDAGDAEGDRSLIRSWTRKIFRRHVWKEEPKMFRRHLFKIILVFSVLGGCVSVGSYPSPVPGIAPSGMYRTSEDFLWRGILYTMKVNKIPVRRANPIRGIVVAGPLPGPVSVAPWGINGRDRAWFRIQVFRQIVPGKVLRTGATTNRLGDRIRVWVRFERQGKDLVWHSLSVSGLHPLRKRKAVRLAKWMDQQIQVGLTRLWVRGSVASY
jgi:hypothetical protein